LPDVRKSARIFLADAKEENERRAELKRLQIIEDAKAVLAQAEKEPVKKNQKNPPRNNL